MQAPQDVSSRLLTAVPIALYNAAVLALIVHVISGWWPGLRIAYLGALMGAAGSLVGVVVRAWELAEVRGVTLRRELQVQAISLGAAVGYGTAGYLLYRSYQARLLVDGDGLRHVPALVLTAIAIVSALAIGWVARALARERASDLGH